MLKAFKKTYWDSTDTKAIVLGLLERWAHCISLEFALDAKQATQENRSRKTEWKIYSST